MVADGTAWLAASSDEGKSWTQLHPRGLPNIAVQALAVDPADDKSLYGMDIGPHISLNGRRWLLTPYTDARGGHMVMEYAVQPTNSPRILMTSIGIKVSTDSGQTWKPALTSKVMFGPVAWEPSKPDVAYAVGFDSSLWRTNDAGKTWARECPETCASRPSCRRPSRLSSTPPSPRARSRLPRAREP